MDTVTVLNTITGGKGKVPERLFNSSAFNKDGVWVLCDDALDADCGCNGQTVFEDEDPETLYELTYDTQEEVD